jgi:CubicO group peptidase (beta-lactamase class C family)
VVTATREPAAMMRADGALDARAERRVEAFEECRGHAGYGTVAVVVAGGGAGGGAVVAGGAGGGAGVEVVFG